MTKGLRYTARFISSGIGGLLLLFAIASLISETIEKGIENGLVPKDPASTMMAIYLVVVPFGVIISWWKEGIGGAILTIYCLVHITISCFLRFGSIEDVSSILFAPFLVSGVLFLICWWRSRRLKIHESAA